MKSTTRFVCQSCGAAAVRWSGQCPTCREWNTMAEERVSPTRAKGATVSKGGNTPVRLDSVTLAPVPRSSTHLSEIDRVLGGGMVPASVILIGGEPGIGKSTLLLQVIGACASNGQSGLYVTGEESLEQIKLRSERIRTGADSAYFLATTNAGDVIDAIRTVRPGVVVVDSIQVLRHPELESSAGSVGQIREVGNLLIEEAKRGGAVMFLVGHVTKEGAIAGPKLLEHMVDTVLYFEGERNGPYRLLRSVKNRFGPTHEIALFEMRGEGLVEVADPSGFFLSQRSANAPGSAVTVTVKGTRPLLVEIQALVTSGSYGFAQRTVIGYDKGRTQLLIAVLEKIAGLQLAACDVFANVAGGIEVDEPAADLAVAVAIASSQRNKPLPADAAVIGEIGLAGEIRSAGNIEARIREAARWGFRRVFTPPAGNDPPPPSGCERIPVRNIHEALEAILGRGPG